MTSRPCSALAAGAQPDSIGQASAAAQLPGARFGMRTRASRFKTPSPLNPVTRFLSDSLC
eukprot:1098953-Rhodomonas_salina.2